MSYRISENWRRGAVIGFLTLTLLISAGAAEPANAQADAPVNAPVTNVLPDAAGVTAEIVAPANAAAPTVGDPIALILRVTHPDGSQVILPQLAQQWGDLEVLEQSPVTTSANGDGSLTTEQTITVASFAPGDVQTPPLLVTVADTAGQLRQAAAAPLMLSIASVLAADESELRDIKPQAALTLPQPVPYAPIFAVSLLALGLLGVAIWRRRSGRPLVDNRTAEQVAIDELVRIGQINLAATARTDETYTLISTCLRSYVERQYHLPALDSTTEELAHTLRSAPISALLWQQLVGLLSECDLAKFARVTPDATEVSETLDRAQRFVTQSAAEIAATMAARQHPSGNDTVAVPAGA